RGLISYHKRMMLVGSQPCYQHNNETGEWGFCKNAEENHKECPKASALNDWYLGALEESLRLMSEEIVALKSN
ncbi:MAG: hypothetical protein IJZ37_06940, partial [Clostridia bacterium]|nr:hypothetical protein [Clostridia bacterium]